ncbi:unnamed protein product [Closterium sp. NIES-64]|nr:unnamed protein product [Closterium sp. NIES-64]
MGVRGYLCCAGQEIVVPFMPPSLHPPPLPGLALVVPIPFPLPLAPLPPSLPLCPLSCAFHHLSPDPPQVAANQSQVHLFINSTAVFTARQLLLTANASASIMNIVMGQGHVRMRILLTGIADNPCAVAPTPPSPRSRP